MSGAKAGDVGTSNVDATLLRIVEILSQSIEARQAGDLHTALLALAQDDGLALTHAMGQVQAGMLHRLLGNRKAGLEAYRAAITLAPHFPEAHLRLGKALLEDERIDEARRSLDRALDLEPANAEARYLRAIVHHQDGQVDAALACLDEAIKSKDEFVEAHRLRIELLGAAGRLEEAVRAASRRLESDPDNFDIWLEKGLALGALARRMDPEGLDSWLDSGKALQALDHDVAALEAFENAVRVRPDSARAHNNRGLILTRLGRYLEAAEAFYHVLRIDPLAVDAMGNHSAIFGTAGLYDLAHNAAEKAIRLRPDLPQAYVNRGLINVKRARRDEARADFEKAVELAPDYAEAWNNLAMLESDANRPAAAIDLFTKALACDPRAAEARTNRGLCRLRIGQFDQGWQDWEARWRQAKFARTYLRPLDLPFWQGEPIGDRRLLVVQEQGLGDRIQFSQLLHLIPCPHEQIAYGVTPALHRLLRPSLGKIRLIDVPADSSGHDLQIYVFSLPYRLGLDPLRWKPRIPYIFPEPERVAHWAARLGSNGCKIGIAWQGSKQGDSERSVPLRTFEALARLPGVRLISLQKKQGLEQISDLPEGMVVESFDDEMDVGPDAFIDTAAMIANLDLVVCSDTSVAHIAGGMGRPVWILLKSAADWRWFTDRSDSVWYPSARLFRQTEPGQWQPVMRDVARAVADSYLAKA